MARDPSLETRTTPGAITINREGSFHERDIGEGGFAVLLPEFRGKPTIHSRLCGQLRRAGFCQRGELLKNKQYAEARAALEAGMTEGSVECAGSFRLG